MSCGEGHSDLSNPYGYGVRFQDRPGPPPGVLPPPQASPWQPQRLPGGSYLPPQQSPSGGQPGHYGPPPGQWAQPYYGSPNQFNGFQPPRRRSGAMRMILLGFGMLAFLGAALAVVGVVLTGSSTGSDNRAEPGVVGPSIVPTPTTH